MFEKLDNHKYLDLLEISETDEWNFRLVIAEAGVIENSSIVTEKEEANEVVRNILNESKAIEVTETSKCYEIIFKDYISYTVTNESYAEVGKDDVFKGKLARIYTKSAFLDYISISTFATSEYPGPFKHYGFCCLNHIIDVASMNAPSVKLIKA